MSAFADIAEIQFAAGQYFEAEDGAICSLRLVREGYVFHNWFVGGYWLGGGGYSERAFRATLVGRKARLVDSSTVTTA